MSGQKTWSGAIHGAADRPGPCPTVTDPDPLWIRCGCDIGSSPFRPRRARPRQARPGANRPITRRHCPSSFPTGMHFPHSSAQLRRPHLHFFFHFCCPQSREVPHPTFQAPPAFAVCPQALALRFQVHSQPAGAFCRVCSQPASESPGTWEITSLPDSEFPVLGHSSTVLFSSPPCPSLRFPLFRVSLPSYSSPQLTGTPG